MHLNLFTYARLGNVTNCSYCWQQCSGGHLLLSFCNHNAIPSRFLIYQKRNKIGALCDRSAINFVQRYAWAARADACVSLVLRKEKYLKITAANFGVATVEKYWSIVTVEHVIGVVGNLTRACPPLRYGRIDLQSWLILRVQITNCRTGFVIWIYI